MTFSPCTAKPLAGGDVSERLRERDSGERHNAPYLRAVPCYKWSPCRRVRRARMIHPGTEYMANVAVIGAQWGDEGKGKIVDWLSARADVVVRFQGGHNAGHTHRGRRQDLQTRLLPSGVVPGKLSIIGNGVVVDPWALVDEIARVGAIWASPSRPKSGRGGKCGADFAAASRARCRARGISQPAAHRHHQARHRPRL